MGGDANIASRRGSRARSRALPDEADSGGSRAPDQNGDARQFSLRSGRSPSRSAHQRRRAAEDALLDAVLSTGNARGEGLGSEVQLLLMRALARITRQADVESAVAWSLDAEAEPRVVGALPSEAATRVRPSASLYRGLASLDRAQSLSTPRLDERLEPLRELGVSAAVPVPGLGAIPAAVLLAYPKRPGRPLRPRTLAVMTEIAARLEQTLTTRLALDRMTRLDGAVRRLDRLAALGGLVSEIVHEVRNPLVSVKTFLQLLPDRLDDPDFHQNFRAVVEDEVARLERMLDDLLRHARPAPEPLPAEPGSRIADAIATTLQLIAYRCREKGVEIVTSVRDGLPAIGLAEDALRQLLLNLLLNASEVTPSGGSITLSADWCPRFTNHVELCVRDEGPGIDAEARTRVFEPFWTTRKSGTGGLGLAICKKIVEEADGSIEAEPGLVGGACFRLSLPIAR